MTAGSHQEYQGCRNHPSQIHKSYQHIYPQVCTGKINSFEIKDLEDFSEVFSNRGALNSVWHNWYRSW